MVLTIVSGGQTGVDRGALRGARDAELPCGGWCPRGRRAEDGPIAGCYPLRETDSAEYAERTRFNVRDSDGTLLLQFGPLRGGCALTAETAVELGKPLLIIDVVGQDTSDAIADVRRFIDRHGIGTLNVAGPRESEAPGAQRWARDLVARLGSQAPAESAEQD